MTADFWTSDQGKIGVVMITPQPPGYFKEGSQGLLDVAISNSVTSQIQTKIHALDTSPLNAVPQRFAAALKARHMNVTVVKQVALGELKKNETAHFPAYDFSDLARSLNVDKLLIISPGTGFSRQYYGFIPISKPKATVAAMELMVTNAKNEIVWLHYYNSAKTVEGDWDNPPDYPILVQAYREALDKAVAELPADLH